MSYMQADNFTTLLKRITKGSHTLVRFAAGLSDNQCQQLANCLKSNSVLLGLDLGGNQITDVGARSLARVLEINKTLELLSLGYNQIASVGAGDLARALESNKTLKELYLNYNQISDPGATALAKAFEKNGSLTKLYLENNKIQDGGANALAGALEVNKTLQFLYLSDNKITDIGAGSLARALEINKTLQILYLESNGISQGIQDKISSKLKANENYRKEIAVALETEVGKLLKTNGFEHLASTFYKEKLLTKEQVAELSKVDMIGLGVTASESSKLIKLFGVPLYLQTEIGALLEKQGLSQYSKLLYNHGITTRDEEVDDAVLEAIGIKDSNDRKNILAIISRGGVVRTSQIRTESSGSNAAGVKASAQNYAGFISHYKKEAGTSAKIMKLILKEMNREEQGLFLDSDNLSDLNELLSDVRHSRALIVILTKSYFSRPWCLAELVEAHRNQIPFVSCRLVGIEEEFHPSEFSFIIDNYTTVTDEKGWSVLANQVVPSIIKEDVKAAIERLSKVIARPFQPHEHEKIQNAQMEIILGDLKSVIQRL